jgi:hypothetical protein
VKEWDEERALAVAFANTHRQKRAEDLLTVAEAFDYLVALHGSQKAVAGIVGLSTEMIREFRSLLKLPEEIKLLIRARKIDSLDVAYRLSMMRSRDGQLRLAAEAADLSVDDVRDIRRLMVRDGLRAKDSKARVLASKLRGLHIFVIDLDEASNKKIEGIARESGLPPAEVLKSVVMRWLSRQKARGSRAV